MGELRSAVVKSLISDALDEGRGTWQVVPLKEVAVIQSGYSYKSAELVEDSTIGMLGIKNFDRSGSFRPDGFKPIKPEKAKQSQYVSIGDIVVAHTDLTQNADIIGRAIQVIDDGGYDLIIESLDLVKVTSARDDVSNEFLAALLGTEDFHRHCLAYVNGTTVLHLGKKALPEYELKIPEDKATMALLDSLFKVIANTQAELIQENRHLNQLRDTLLPKLMSGEIDVSNIELPTQPNNHLSCLSSYPNRMFPSSPMKGTVMETTINLILAQMQPLLSCDQLKRLGEVLRFALSPRHEPSTDLLQLFLTAKEVEGCSARTITYYESTIQNMVESVGKPYTQIESDDLRGYLADYESRRNTGKVTIDNIRRILSSFFSWLEDEDYIVKSPVRRIHRVKTATVAKEVLSDEDLETLRDSCANARDLAIIDMLATTGMRVGELVGLDIADIDLQERECVVTGKGNKQRPVYFDARAKLHLQAYLDSRTDDSPALFVSLDSSATRLSIGGVETRLRNLGKVCGVLRVHPHKFRRTLATHAIDKGMPVEQVQKLLGHARIDTTMHYAMVNQNNVKASHRKYLE